MAAMWRRRAAFAAPRATPITIANASGALSQTMSAVMDQQGFLEAFGLAPEVLQVADGSRILGGIVGGTVDLSAMSGFAQIFPAIERGASIKVLAGAALVPMLALFSGKPAIRTLRDLEGKTLGTGSIGALVYQLTVTLLRQRGVNVADIRFVNIGSSSDILRAVAAGTVDAGAGDAALVGLAAEYGVHALEDGNMSVELPQYTFQGSWTTERHIATERDTLVRALAAYASLYRFVQDAANQAAFLRAGGVAFPQAPERDHLALWNYVQRYRPYAIDLTLSPERLRYLQEINISFKMQSQVLPFARVADMSIASDALRLMEQVKGLPSGRQP
jgi:ABC-type nitrate/sulfonate/bicarbonate transport system substrate-binding protein